MTAPGTAATRTVGRGIDRADGSRPAAAGDLRRVDGRAGAGGLRTHPWAGPRRRRYGAYVSGAAFDASFSITEGDRAVESLVVDNLTAGSANASILHYFNNGTAGALTYRGNLLNVIDMSPMTTTYAACSETGTVLQPEALIYARPLSDAERRQVEHYLAARHGISIP